MDIRQVGTKIDYPGVSGFGAKISQEKDESMVPRESFVSGSGEFVGEQVSVSGKGSSLDAASLPVQVDPSTYQFKSEFKVTQEGGKWVMHLPNAKIPMPGRPVWLERIDQMNEVLARHSNPPALRNHFDSIMDIATKSYDATTTRFEPALLNSYVERVQDSETLTGLRTLFQMRLDDEAKSTAQVGGVMAGSRCSMMHTYGAIMKALGV